MPKPMRRPKTKALAPTVVGAKEKETEKRDIYPVFKNGRIEHFDVKTGEKVNSSVLVKAHIEAYNQTKVDLLLASVACATPFRQALKDAKISYSSYLMWRKHNPDLEANVKKAKSLRAEAITEEMYEHDMVPIMSTNIGNLDMAEASIYEKKLKVLKAKQSVFKSFRSIEGEYVEMNKNNHNVNVAAAVKIEIPEKVVKLVEQNFRPSLKGERVILPSPSDDIIELETELREE